MFWYIQALQQFGQGAFSGSGTADNPDDLTGLNLQRHAVQYRRAIGAITETNVFETDVALDRRQGLATLRQLIARIENIAQTAHRNADLLKILPQLRQPQYRRSYPLRHHIESDQLADRQLAVNHQFGTEIQSQQGHHFSDQLNQLLPQIAQRADPKAGCYIGRQLVVPALRELRLDRHRLDGLHARHRLDQEGWIIGTACKFFTEAGAQQRIERHRHEAVHRQGHHHNHRQPDAVDTHHADEDDGKNQVQHRSQGLAGQEAADIFQLAHTRDGVAHTTRTEVAQRQCQQMPEQACAEFHIDAIGGVGKHIVTQPCEQDLKHRADQQGHTHHVQGAEGTIDQHLVHDHLKHQGRHQTKQLQYRGDKKYFQQQAAVFHHSRDEPGKIKARQFAGERSTRGKQQHAPAGTGNHLAWRTYLGAVFIDVQHQRLLSITTGKNEMLAVIAQHQGRKRCVRKSLWSDLDTARLEPDRARRQGQIALAKCLAARTGGMLQLCGIGSNSMVTGNQNQCRQTSITCPRRRLRDFL